MSYRSLAGQDQGSVENMNKLVKRTLGCVLAERRLAGENPNWTEVLGSVAAFINSQHGRGKFDVSAYQAVFGQEFDHELACSKEEARKCWTIEDQLQVTNDTAFQEYVKEYFYLDADRDEDDLSYEDDSRYFLDDNINESKMEERDDTFFDEHLMDDVSEDVSKQPALHLDDRKSPHATEDERTHSPAISYDDKTEDETKHPPAISFDDKTEDERKHPPAISFADKNQDETSPKNYTTSVDIVDENGLKFAPQCNTFYFTRKTDCNQKLAGPDYPHSEDIWIPVASCIQHVRISRGH